METLDAPSLNGTLEEIKDNAIKEALKRFDGNRTQAAKYLGVSRSYLWRHLNGVGK